MVVSIVAAQAAAEDAVLAEFLVELAIATAGEDAHFAGARASDVVAVGEVANWKSMS